MRQFRLVTPDDAKVLNDSMCSGGANREEITVDGHLITGEIRHARIVRQSNGTVGPGTMLYSSSRVLRGSCLAVVIGTGRQVALSKLIKAGRWPPCADLLKEVREIARKESRGRG
ncbi:hypothetical protein ACHAW5_009472 [Stephanodiscus triporus]|uniref:P-type ATPase A domain-containing protein n=1 Tax=Stephanodiscus triporus TaxID=2934178 RepID=A0ABD3QSH7_9STRA